MALVLEEYEHAPRRDAKIYSEAVVYGSTCDAHHITATHPQACMHAVRHGRCGLSPGESVYINSHDTGTPMNDVIEHQAIKLAMGEEAARRVIVSSTKSMAGHMLGAAGASTVPAYLYALCEGVIPPTINLLEQDETCNLRCAPNAAVSMQADLALSNFPGFGGTISAWPSEKCKRNERRRYPQICDADAADTNPFSVYSPIVGVFYAAPAENAEPYVTIGDRIEQGRVLCIIEAMKLMNEICA